MTTARPTPFVARSSADLVALVPISLGFHPERSVVLMTFGSPGESFHARVDLPTSARERRDVVEMLGSAVVRNGPRQAALVLFTDDVAAAEAIAADVVARLLELGLAVIDVLRVDGGRFHAVPDDGTDGTPYDGQAHRFTAQHVFDGRLVHRDREALAASLVGADTDDATAVALAATRFADEVLTTAARDGDFWATQAHWLRRLVRRAVEESRPVPPADAGRALVLAAITLTRDVAWALVRRPEAAGHVELWRDLVRRAPRDLVPGAAGLLAFAAWQLGDGALAWCAVDRCLDVDPDHVLARGVGDLLTGAVPPTAWTPPDLEGLEAFAGGVPSAAPDAERAS